MPFDDRPADDWFCLWIAWRISHMHVRKLNGCQQRLLFVREVTLRNCNLCSQGKCFPSRLSYNFQVCQLSRIIQETYSRFWTISRGLQIRVWNLPDNCWSLSFLVDSTMKFQILYVFFELFYCWHWTFPHKLRYAIVIWAIIWLVGSKPIRSNATIPTTSFLHVFFFHKWHHVLCIMTSSITPFPSIFNIWRHVGLTALNLY